MSFKTITEQFADRFIEASYDGSYGNERADAARRSFDRLTDSKLNWSQVHGDFKDAAKRALFEPYEHWPELYRACRDVLRQHQALGTLYLGGYTCAQIMREAMTVMRRRDNLNVPRWWLPIMDDLRGKNNQEEKARKPSRQMEVRNGAVVYKD